MRNTLAAGAAYFASVFAAGFVMGTVRTLLIAPHTGATVAVMIELPVILTIAWVTCQWAVRTFRVPDSLRHRLAMGAVAFGLLMAGEAAVSLTLGGKTIREHLALYRQNPHILGLAGQVGFGLFPLLQRGHGERRSGADDRD